jgi:hypothetical protein
MALIDNGERFGHLEVVGLLSDDPEDEPRYGLRCHRCKCDGVTAREDSLLSGRVKLCYDCNALAKMTPHEKVVIAFRRSLDLTPTGEEIDRVPSIHAVPRLTIADALSEAAYHSGRPPRWLCLLALTRPDRHI